MPGWLQTLASLGLSADAIAFVTAANNEAMRAALGVSEGGGSGSVTSVDVSGGTTGLTFSGGPVTSSGTITLAGTLAVANGGTGATDAAGARTALELVIGTDVPPVNNAALTGTPTAPTPTSSDDSTQIATTAFVQDVVASAVTGLLEFQGDLDCSTNPNYPAGLKGDTYYASVAGKIGGASGKPVDVGDAIVCKTDNAGGSEASVGTSWFVLEHNVAGALLASNNLSDLTDAATARTNLSLVIGTHVQAYSANLAAIAGVTSAANKGMYFTGSGTASLYDLTSYGRTWGGLADAAAGRSNLGLILEPLSANRTYYVRTDGSDSNTGLVNSSGGAFLTWQKAMDVISESLDLGPYGVTVQIANGTYTAGLTLKSYRATTGTVTFQGNAATPANVLISTTSANAISSGADVRGVFTIKDIEMRTTTSGSAMDIRGLGSYVKINNVRLGTCASYHCFVADGAVMEASGNFAVTGNAQVGLWATGQALINIATRTITYSNSPVFSARNFTASEDGFISAWSVTFTNGGTVTGTRYALGSGKIFTNGASSTYIPGNSAGTGNGVNGGVYY